MVKSWLRDDVDVTGLYEGRATQSDPVPVRLDDDCWEPTVAPLEPFDPPTPPDAPRLARQWRFVVKQRTRTGFDADGNPEFAWADVFVGTSVLYEERSEFDHMAGMTAVTAKVVLLYEGPEMVYESAVAVREDGVRYSVTKTDWGPSRVTLTMKRLDQQPDVAVAP